MSKLSNRWHFQDRQLNDFVTAILEVINGNIDDNNFSDYLTLRLSRVRGSLIPELDNTYNLGSSTLRWKDLYVGGLAYIDQIGKNLDVNSKTLFNVGGFTASANLDIGAYSFTAQTLIGANLTVVNTITEFSTDGTLADNSDSAVPTEKATKTYVDNAVSNANLYAFKTITGITNDVVADAIGDTLTLSSGNTILEIVGDTPTDTITFTVDETQINHDNLSGFVANEHIDWTNTSQNLLTTGNITAGGLAIDTDTLYVDSTNDRVGIRRTEPEYTFDINGGLRASLSLTAGINIESLTGDKTLTPGTDEMYQYLDPNGTHRVIYLDTSNAKAGDRFIIRNNGDYNSSFYIQIKQGTTTLDYVYAGAVKEFIFDSTNWISASTGSGEYDDKKYNVAIGREARGYTRGVAVGYSAYGYSDGVAVGYVAQGYTRGVAVGYSAYGYSYGAAVGYYAYGYSDGAAVGYKAQGYSQGVAVGCNTQGYTSGTAVGYYAQGYTRGVAVGYSAYGYSYGAAVGYYAYGYSDGAAVGYNAYGYSDGAAVGYKAQGYSSGVAVGRYAHGLRKGVAIGYLAGYGLDSTDDRYNIFIGYQAGRGISTGLNNIIIGRQDSGTGRITSGSNNILIGYEVSAGITDTDSNQLNIGNLIFGTGLTSGATLSTGKVGIGTTSPASTLDVAGDIHCTGKLTSDGGNDPPYVLYNYESRNSIMQRIKKEIPPDKLNGAVLFFNGEANRLEIFVPVKGEFRDITGKLIAKVKPN